MIEYVSILWLFSALLFTNAYKAEFKTNYIFEPVYSRNWTSKLLDMNDFQIFIGVEQVEYPMSELLDGHYIPGIVCNDRTLRWYEILRSDLRRHCALLDRYSRMKLNEIQSLPPEIRRKTLAYLDKRIRLVPTHWEILYTGYADGCAEILCPKWAAFCVQKSGIAYFILIVYTM